MDSEVWNCLHCRPCGGIRYTTRRLSACLPTLSCCSRRTCRSPGPCGCLGRAGASAGCSRRSVRARQDVAHRRQKQPILVILENVKVPKINMLCVRGMKGPFSCLNSARLGISFGALGSAQYCLEKSLDYSQQRTLFRQYLAEKQLLQMKMANMTTEWNLALLSCMHVADLFDKNQSTPEMISLIKRNNCQKALEIARSARDIHGGNGISDEYHVVRHSMNLEAVNTYEGTSDIHALILGQKQTNISSF